MLEPTAIATLGVIGIGLKSCGVELINKISNALGGLYAPMQIKRTAKAEAKATVTKAQGEIDAADLRSRAAYRLSLEETQRQKNIEAILTKALPELSDDSDPSAMDNDWITNFFDKSRIVSDDAMQNLWSRILAGEANSPGTYSKRTVNFLSDMDKKDADLFTKLCGFCCTLGDVIRPLIFHPRGEIYDSNGVNDSSLAHLNSIGLIQYHQIQVTVTVSNLPKPKCLFLDYQGQAVTIEMKNDHDGVLYLGYVEITKTGRELYPICGSKRVDGFVDILKENLFQKYRPEHADGGKGSD